MTSGGTDELDLARYAPHLIGVVSNAWLRLTSAEYRRRFGIGIVEWRVLATIRIEPAINAHRICEVIRIDKAAASRALRILETSGYLTYEASSGDSRRRLWSLSKSGEQLHADILAIAREYERHLLSGIAPDALNTFFQVMGTMRENIDRVSGGSTAEPEDFQGGDNASMYTTKPKKN